MSAPELVSRTAEAQARVGATRDQRLEMEARGRSVREQKAEAAAKLTADEGTYRRLKAASATPGVVAENDVDIARQNVEADRARVRALEENEKAAQAVVQSQTENEQSAVNGANSLRDIESYLIIRAPFDGIITERNVDKGSLAGPSSGSGSTPMLRIQQVSTLRLVVAVPEADVAAVTRGDKIQLRVSQTPTSKNQKTSTARQTLSVIDYPGRRWVTRKNIHIDRLASAWLIKQFIDKQPRFYFVSEGEALDKAIPFDMFGAKFTHHGEDCTSETMIKRFGLSQIKGLRELAEIVHDIDLKDDKFHRLEGAGFKVMIDGLCESIPDDRKRLQQAGAIFDGLIAVLDKQKPKRDKKDPRKTRAALKK